MLYDLLEFAGFIVGAAGTMFVIWAAMILF